jgi:hypothetical protein
MKSKIFTWATIAILLVFNCLFLFSAKNRKVQTVDVERIVNQNSNRYNYIIEQLLLYMQYDNNKIQDIPVKKIKYEQFLDENKSEQEIENLSQILKGEKLVLYFTQLACNSCVSEQILTLDKLRRKMGKESILLLTDYARDDVNLFLKSQKINLELYEIGNLDIGLNLSAEAPALLLLTTDNTVATSFILNADTKDYTNLFYDFVETKFIEIRQQSE